MPKYDGRNGVVLLGGYDVSGDSSAVEWDQSTEAHDSTGMGGTTDKTFVAGLNDTKVSQKGFFDDTAAAGLYTALVALKGTFFVASFCPGGDTQGLPAIGMASKLPTDLKINSPVNNVVVLDATYQDSGGAHLGLVIEPRTTLTGTGAAQNQASSLDNGALTSNGGEVYFHITAVGAGTVSVFKLQHSPDNSSWADLVASTLTGSVIGSQHLTVAANTTVNRYLRVTTTCTNGVSYTTFCSFKRN